MVKGQSANQETRIQSLHWRDPLEQGMATHSSSLPWRIPWLGAWWATVHRDHRAGHDWATKYTHPWCKTQNSGLRSKEEKPRDPINQPSRCNTQEGLLTVAQTGDSDLLGGRAHRTANWAGFYGQKPFYQHITYGLQSDWLHVCKAIPLVQTSRAFVQT